MSPVLVVVLVEASGLLLIPLTEPVQLPQSVVMVALLTVVGAVVEGFASARQLVHTEALRAFPEAQALMVATRVPSERSEPSIIDSVSVSEV
jgi:hypothetical protein